MKLVELLRKFKHEDIMFHMKNMNKVKEES
jgi:hypothetical protein